MCECWKPDFPRIDGVAFLENDDDPVPTGMRLFEHAYHDVVTGNCYPIAFDPSKVIIESFSFYDGQRPPEDMKELGNRLLSGAKLYYKNVS